MSIRSPKPSPVPDADWRAHLAALARSGQSVPEYARAHGIKPDTLYRWRRREAAAPRLVPTSVEAAAPCEVVFPDGRVLRLPSTLDPSTLGAWVAAMVRR